MKRENRRPILALLMLTMLTLSIQAQDLSKKMNATFKNTPLSEVLKTIGKKTGVRVEFAYDDVNGYKVSTQLTGVNAETAVKTVINGHPLTYKVVGGKFIIVSRKASATRTSTIVMEHDDDTNTTTNNNDHGNDVVTVKGTVLDDAGNPVIGAWVSMEGKRGGAMSDVNGRFSLDVPDSFSGYLTFSYIGMKKERVRVNKATASRCAWCSTKTLPHSTMS